MKTSLRTWVHTPEMRNYTANNARFKSDINCTLATWEGIWKIQSWDVNDWWSPGCKKMQHLEWIKKPGQTRTESGHDYHRDPSTLEVADKHRTSCAMQHTHSIGMQFQVFSDSRPQFDPWKQICQVLNISWNDFSSRQTTFYSSRGEMQPRYAAKKILTTLEEQSREESLRRAQDQVHPDAMQLQCNSMSRVATCSRWTMYVVSFLLYQYFSSNSCSKVSPCYHVLRVSRSIESSQTSSVRLPMWKVI